MTEILLSRSALLSLRDCDSLLLELADSDLKVGWVTRYGNKEEREEEEEEERKREIEIM